LKLGKDLLFVLEHDRNDITQYSKMLMCEDTGISYEEPSPNTFSFNSPYGACPYCRGLGTSSVIKMDAVLPDTSKSIKEGGIAPLGEERSASVYQQVVAFAKKHKISLSKPINEMPQQQLDLLLYGDGNAEKTLQLDGTDDSIPDYYTGSYEGIIPMLKRWYLSTQSTEALRDWVEQYMEVQSCPSCNGARLKKESLWFKVDGRNIADLSNLNLDNLAAWLDGIEQRLTKKQNTIAKDILKEIRERLGFLLDVGLSYLSLNRPSRTLSGGESQRIRLATQIGSQLQGITYILDEPSI